MILKAKGDKGAYRNHESSGNPVLLHVIDVFFTDEFPNQDSSLDVGSAIGKLEAISIS